MHANGSNAAGLAARAAAVVLALLERNGAACGALLLRGIGARWHASGIAGKASAEHGSALQSTLVMRGAGARVRRCFVGTDYPSAKRT